MEIDTSKDLKYRDLEREIARLTSELNEARDQLAAEKQARIAAEAKLAAVGGVLTTLSAEGMRWELAGAYGGWKFAGELRSRLDTILSGCRPPLAVGKMTLSHRGGMVIEYPKGTPPLGEGKFTVIVLPGGTP